MPAPSTLTVAGNINDIDVTKVPTSTSVLNPAPTLFARSRILTLESGTPGEKVTGTLDWSRHDIGATGAGHLLRHRAAARNHGDRPPARERPADATNDIYTGKKAIADLELRYQPTKGAQVAVGVSNLLDTYPDKTAAYLNTTGVTSFPSYSPFGFNGRFLYARAGLNW